MLLRSISPRQIEVLLDIILHFHIHICKTRMPRGPVLRMKELLLLPRALKLLPSRLRRELRRHPVKRLAFRRNRVLQLRDGVLPVHELDFLELLLMLA